MHTTLEDHQAISDLMTGWMYRDLAQWDQLAGLFHPDGTIEVTWFEGPATDFIEGSQRMGQSDLRTKHFVGQPIIRFNGSRAIVEFRFKPDAASKVQPQTLLAVRIFTPDAWAKAVARKGPAIGIKLAERGNDVYVVALAGGNPYKTGTAAADLFDKMMLAVFNTAPRLTPR